MFAKAVKYAAIIYIGQAVFGAAVGVGVAVYHGDKAQAVLEGVVLQMQEALETASR